MKPFPFFQSELRDHYAYVHGSVIGPAYWQWESIQVDPRLALAYFLQGLIYPKYLNYCNTEPWE